MKGRLHVNLSAGIAFIIVRSYLFQPVESE